MYQGFSKDNGSVIGHVNGGGPPPEVDVTDAQDSTSVEEILLCSTFIPDELLGNPPSEAGGEERPIALSAAIDPSSGDIVWHPSLDTDGAKCRTVAMSQMSSMLRDNDRNNVFSAAIKAAITNFNMKMNRAPVVLDVGCGTSLLSQYAARHGATFTYAVEMFDAMAGIASEVATNAARTAGVEPSIHVIHAKSSDIDTLPVNADLLVSELLDSALLGECVIPSHKDAIERLIRHDYDEILPVSDRVIPHRAVVYATPVESAEISSMVSTTELSSNQPAGFSIYRDNETATQCRGGWPQIPLHWDAYLKRGGRTLSEPTAVLGVPFHEFSFVLSANGQFQVPKTFCTDIEISSDGLVHGIMLWWKTYLLSEALDPEGQYVYSTEPGAQNWQDHWQQTVFPLSTPVQCSEGDILRVYASHDDLSVWLQAEKLTQNDVVNSSSRKRNTEASAIVAHQQMMAQYVLDERFSKTPCTCGWHMLCGADRLAMLNSKRYIPQWQTTIQRLVSSAESTVIQAAGNASEAFSVMDLSDGSILGLWAASLAKSRGWTGDQFRVTNREKKLFSRLFLDQLVDVNDLNDQLFIWNGESMNSIGEYYAEDGIPAPIQFHALIGECFYYQAHLRPIFEALMFHYQRTAMSPYLRPGATIIPSAARVMMVPMEMPNLKNCHGLVHSVDGIDHRPLDDRQSHWHQFYYPYRLANYLKRPLAAATPLCIMDFTGPVQSFSQMTSIPITSYGNCDGLAIWVDYSLGGDQSIQHWDGQNFPAYMTQTVRFLSTPRLARPGEVLNVIAQFEVGSSDINFDFQWA